MMRFRKCGQGQDDTGTARRHGDDTSGATDGDVRNMFSYCKARAFLLVSYKKTFLHTGAMRALNRSIKTTHTGAFICLLQETDEAPPPQRRPGGHPSFSCRPQNPGNMGESRTPTSLHRPHHTHTRPLREHHPQPPPMLPRPTSALPQEAPLSSGIVI
jgi:hypothetical protein